MRRYLPPVVAAVVLTAGLQTASPAGASSDPDPGTVSVLAWNEFTVAKFLAPPNPIPGPVGPLYLTYLHRAVYDAVEDLPRKASLPAAVAAAARGVLNHYFSTRTAEIDAQYDLALADIRDGEAEDRGVKAGADAAAALIAERKDDVLTGSVDVAPAGPGIWQPEPPATFAVAAFLRNIEPFVLTSPSQLRPAGPPALSSNEWVRDYEETKTLGASTSTVRKPKQTAAALFWADPPAVQSQRALRGYAVQEKLDGMETARLFALVNTASADALIACADAKIEFNFWRPVGAIRADDGNPATASDESWTPLITTPPFPEYPSNHGCSTTAIATVIDGLDGDSDFELTITSVRGDPAVTYETTFESARQLIREVGNARIWAGIHFRFSVEDGTDIGRAVADEVLRAEG